MRRNCYVVTCWTMVAGLMTGCGSDGKSSKERHKER